ncbi:ATP-binding protein [Hymenobacter humi]|uniref:ATP-binding protein n=1 Tax=Hymenobacter humi TaxID=1411620 RepID=A0ABW2U1Y9_9BACT
MVEAVCCSGSTLPAACPILLPCPAGPRAAAHPRAGAARPAADSPRRPAATRRHGVRAWCTGAAATRPGPWPSLAYRLATGNPAAHWPRAAGAATNTLLEGLDFTISTKRPVLTSGSAHDGDETARQQAEALYTGQTRERAEAPATKAAEPAAAYDAPAYSRPDALAELFITEIELDAALAGLARRRNLLLQGPPGTGKTFLARRLAWLLLGAKDESRIEPGAVSSQLRLRGLYAGLPARCRRVLPPRARRAPAFVPARRG